MGILDRLGDGLDGAGDVLGEAGQALAPLAGTLADGAEDTAGAVADGAVGLAEAGAELGGQAVDALDDLLNDLGDDLGGGSLAGFADRTDEVLGYLEGTGPGDGVLLARAYADGVAAAFGVGDGADVDYLAVGASDAFGIGAEPLQEGYVYRIAEAVEDRTGDVDLLNLGLPSAEVGTIAAATDAALDQGFDPDLVTVWVGANDLIAGQSPEDFADGLGGLLEDLAATDATVLVANLTDLTELPAFRDTEEPEEVTEARVAAFNTVIEDAVAANDLTLVDIADVQFDDQLVADDGFHPSTDGHAALAQAFLAALPEPADDMLLG